MREINASGCSLPLDCEAPTWRLILVYRGFSWEVDRTERETHRVVISFPNHFCRIFAGPVNILQDNKEKWKYDIWHILGKLQSPVTAVKYYNMRTIDRWGQIDTTEEYLNDFESKTNISISERLLFVFSLFRNSLF